MYDLFNRVQKKNPSSAEGEGAKAQWRSFLRSNQSIIVQVMISANFFNRGFILPLTIILKCFESNCMNTNNNCEGHQVKKNFFPQIHIHLVRGFANWFLCTAFLWTDKADSQLLLLWHQVDPISGMLYSKILAEAKQQK